MESNNYENFITNTVESMLPRFSDKGICLAMIIRMEWTDYGYDKSGNKKVREEFTYYRKVLVVFHRSSNYTKVLFKDVTSGYDHWLRVRDDAEIEMKQLSDHDSCWRSDGMRWVFETFCKAWDFFEEKGIEGRDIDPMFGYDIFGGNPSYYHIDMKLKDESDKFSYLVKIGKKIPMNEISKFMKNADF